MLTDLSAKPLIVGIKQSTRAVRDNAAEKAYVARNADPNIRVPFCELCKKKDVPVEEAESMEELGRACGINVGAAVAVILKEDCK